jgi:hypothetical protein
MDQGTGEIREAIENTREDLADTIEALGKKVDVKARVGEKVKEGGERAATHTRHLVEQAQSVVPDDLVPAVGAAAETMQQAGRRATATRSRTALVVGAACLAVALAVMAARRRRQG